MAATVTVPAAALRRVLAAYDTLASLAEIIPCDGERDDCAKLDASGHSHSESAHRCATDADLRALRKAFVGTAHDMEPDSLEDFATASWFEDPLSDGGPPEDGPERSEWMRAEMGRHAKAGKLKPNALAAAIRALNHINENAGWDELERALNAAGCDTYNSDSRFIAWPPGLRVPKEA